MSNLAVTSVSDARSYVDEWLKQEQNGERFPVDFDIAWRLAGYSTKQKAQNKLKYLAEGEDFLTDRLKSSTGGRRSKLIELTCDAFKHFCLLAETEQGRQIRQYFIECEKKWRVVQEQHPSIALEIELQKLRNEGLQLERKKTKAELDLLEFRALVTKYPELVQQKILGYSTIKEVEYRDRVIVGDEVINEGDTINKTALCYHYGFVTRNGKPNYKHLNACLESLDIPSEAWKLTAQIRENQELRKDYLPELDRLMMSDDRQLWLGE